MPSRRELANAIRVLSMDAIQQAKSGHPGAPMGMADIAEVLWNSVLRHNPANPDWVDRDRFVLSNGHGAMLLYALLHLTGYDLPMAALAQFRQWRSQTPGHPEYGCTPGVETTTGPLGQGLGNAVGMALAERIMAAQFNRPGHAIVDHHTYVLLGDGCLMEGISHEVCSFAGTLGLGKLIGIYDDNGISIDGDVKHWFTDDTPGRFEAYGWQVIRDVDGHDADAVRQALEAARAETGKPSLICAKTVIGMGAPNKAGGHDVHGAPLGEPEVAATRAQLGWPHEPFVIPEDIYAGWDGKAKGARAESDWNAAFAAYQAAFPADAAEFKRRMAGELPTDWAERAAAVVAAAQADGAAAATRKHSQNALEGFGPMLPELVGGSADLTPSNNTFWSGSKRINVHGANAFSGNYLSYGVREFGMSAIMNGMALHGGVRPYGATFLTFSDYARNALRLAALMRTPAIFVYTHDSIGLGEDGPTHQPVEQLASLRLIPNMAVWRPCDGVETAAAWRAAIERRDGPSCVVLTRQGVPHQARSPAQTADIARGGYVLLDAPQGEPDTLIIATGSEVGLAVQAAETLNAAGGRVRVVSMPCTDAFEAQDAAYQAAVLPAAVTRRVAVEAGVSAFWRGYVGSRGQVIGLDRFGASAPAGLLFEAFGFTVDNLIATIESL